MKIALQGLFPDELRALCVTAGEPAFRGQQLWQWLQAKGTTQWEQIRNLPKPLKKKLAQTHTPEPVKILKESGSAGGTRKWLFELDDGETIETVLIPARTWTTICLSTQVGCKMGCVFCASGQSGFARHLSAGEIVAQLHTVAALTGRRPDNVVYMGMGEPLDNYAEVLQSIRLLNHPEGLNIGARRITISSCGITPAIRKLATEGLQVELSVSLHAPNRELRRKLMPIENKYPLPDLIAACRDYTRQTKRFVTFEYTLIQGVNDSPANARELARLLRPFSCRVNLIPLSPVAEFAGSAPPRTTIEAFQRTVEQHGVSVTLRASKGQDADAACGQLRRRMR